MLRWAIDDDPRAGGAALDGALNGHGAIARRVRLEAARDDAGIAGCAVVSVARGIWMIRTS